MPQSALLFDLDGTLVDTLELLLESMRHAFEEHPHPPSTEDWIAGIGTPLATQLEVYARDKSDLQRLAERYRSYQRLNHDRLTRAYKGVVEVVATLHGRGHPMAVVTSKANDIANRTVRHVGLAPYLPLIVGVESTTRHKPDPEPVAFALGGLGVSADNALFVGDSPHDIAAGASAGVTTVAALWGIFRPEVLRAAGPYYELEDISGLPELVGG